MDSFELKYKIKGDRNLNSIVYSNEKDLIKSIQDILKGYLQIDNARIKGYSDFEEFHYISRNYDEYSEGTYYQNYESEDEKGNITINRIEKNEILTLSGDYETDTFQPKEKDITYNLSEQFGFHTNKIGKIYFIDGDIIINGKPFISQNSKFNKSISKDFLRLLSLYFYKNMDKNEVSISELQVYFKSSKKKIIKFIKNGLKENNINNEDIRRTYIPTINKNIEKIYKNQPIFKKDGQLIKRIAIKNG